MILALTERDGLADADDVADQTAAERYRSRTEWFSRLRWRIDLIQSPAERLIDHLLQAFVLGAAQPFQRGGDIVVDRQGRSHASRHNIFDVLMQSSSSSPEI